jgi:hypothetical protein
MDANLNEGIDHATRKIYLCHTTGLAPRPTIDCPLNGVYNMFSGVLLAGDTGPWGKVEIRSAGVTEHGVYGSSQFDGKGPTAKGNVNICCIPTHEFPGLGPQGANVGGRGRVDDGSWQVFGMWFNPSGANSPPNLMSFTIPADLSVMEGHWFHGSRTPKPWKLVKDNYLQLGIHKDYTSR